MALLKNNWMYWYIAISGAAVLAIEVVAIRILAPYFGNTIYSTTSVISVILAALSMGYYIGGIIADKKPTIATFFKILLISGLLTLIFYFISMFLLPIIANNYSFVTGPLISSIALFFIPAALLGMLSPITVKIQVLHDGVKNVGSVSGKTFFYSTMGSIVGSLVTGFFLIPSFGLNHILIVTSIILVLMGGIPLLTTKFTNLSIFVICITITLSTVLYSILFSAEPNSVYASDGVYQRIKILDTMFDDQLSRLLILDKSTSSGMVVINKQHAFRYTQYYELYKLIPSTVENAVVLGAGAGTITHSLATELSNANIESIEIEERLFDLSEEYFYGELPTNVTNYADDGRMHIRNSETTYDFAYLDAFSSLYSIPYHLTTTEFFETMYNKMSTESMLVTNTIGKLANESFSFFPSIYKTACNVFDNCYVFTGVSDDTNITQNLVLVATKGNYTIDFPSVDITQFNQPELKFLGRNYYPTNLDELSEGIELTDNYAPVDAMISKIVRELE